MNIIHSKGGISLPVIEVVRGTKSAKEKLCISISSGHIIIDKLTITHLVAEGNYTTIYYNGQKVICSQTLGSLMKKLAHPNFIRIHKSHVINIAGLAMIDNAFSMVTLDSGVQLAVARSKKQELRDLIKDKYD